MIQHTREREVETCREEEGEERTRMRKEEEEGYQRARVDVKETLTGGEMLAAVLDDVLDDVRLLFEAQLPRLFHALFVWHIHNFDVLCSFGGLQRQGNRKQRARNASPVCCGRRSCRVRGGSVSEHRADKIVFRANKRHITPEGEVGRARETQREM